MFSCRAETSKASNSHRALYPSPPGRAIDTGVEWAEPRFIAAVSLLLINQCAWQRWTKSGSSSSRYKSSKPWVLHRNTMHVVTCTHGQLAFSTNVHSSCTKRCTHLLLEWNPRAKRVHTFALRVICVPKIVNAFALRANRDCLECGSRSLSMWNALAQRVTRYCFIPCAWCVLYIRSVKYNALWWEVNTLNWGGTVIFRNYECIHAQ